MHREGEERGYTRGRCYRRAAALGVWPEWVGTFARAGKRLLGRALGHSNISGVDLCWRRDAGCRHLLVMSGNIRKLVEALLHQRSVRKRTSKHGASLIALDCRPRNPSSFIGRIRAGTYAGPQARWQQPRRELPQAIAAMAARQAHVSQRARGFGIETRPCITCLFPAPSTRLRVRLGPSTMRSSQKLKCFAGVLGGMAILDAFRAVGLAASSLANEYESSGGSLSSLGIREHKKTHEKPYMALS